MLIKLIAYFFRKLGTTMGNAQEYRNLLIGWVDNPEDGTHFSRQAAPQMLVGCGYRLRALVQFFCSYSFDRRA